VWTDHTAPTPEVGSYQVGDEASQAFAPLQSEIESSPIPVGITYPAPSVKYAHTIVANDGGAQSFRPAPTTAPQAPLIDAPNPFSSAAVTFEAVASAPAAAPPAQAAPPPAQAGPAPYVPAANPWAPPLPPPPAESASVDMPYVVPYTPFASTPSSVSGAPSAPDSAHTVSAWMIAVLPALLAGSLLAAATELGEFYTRFVQVGIVLVIVLMMLSLGVRDSREMREAGYKRTASPGLLLLTPPVYLIARYAVTKREVGHGAGPMILGLLVAALVAALIVVGQLMAPGVLMQVVIA
jgi:hypothetical protein